MVSKDYLRRLEMRLSNIEFRLDILEDKNKIIDKRYKNKGASCHLKNNDFCTFDCEQCELFY